MTAFVVIVALMCAATVAVLAGVGSRRRSPGDAAGEVKRQLLMLRELHEAGALSQEQFEASRTQLEPKLAEALQTPASAIGERPSRALVAGMAVLVAVVAGGGYAWLGVPSGVEVAPGQPGAEVAGAAEGNPGNGAAPHEVGAEQIASMVDRLAERLKQQPDDAQGWTMLARSYVVLGKHAQALQAFAEAERLLPNDATLLVDHADALAVTQQRSLAGEPMKLVEKALRIDPSNVKALALAGTDAFNRGDYAGAARRWEQALKSEPPDSEFAKQLQSGLDQARQLAGGAAASLAAAGEAAAPAGPSAAAAEATAPSSGRVSGSVTLSPALKSKASPDDTVFVFARAAEGPRMPLAVLRRQVKDLPLDFTLDDSMAMSPAARLSSAGRVIVGARISKSGSASPQPGDLQGSSAAVAVGASGLRIEIDQPVSK